MVKAIIALVFILSCGCSSLSQKRGPTNEPAESVKVFVSGSLDPKKMSFISHTGPGAFDNALALNIPYAPINELRAQIERVTGRLAYFKGWDPQGEAHVTIITPPEFAHVLSKFLTMDDIEGIASANRIQSADLVILGIGSGKKEVDESAEETFFVIVDSQKLRHIRNEIWKLFVKKGGNPKSWDPTWFFPHITIGFTDKDIHEPDVIKNIRSSLDQRFHLVLQ